MSGMLSIGVSALRAYRSALDVTSGNIANAASPGYARRSASLAEISPSLSGGLFGARAIGGSGVNATAIERAYHRFLAADALSAASASGFARVKTNWLESMQSALGSSEQGLAPQLTRFFSAAEAVAASPTEGAPRAQFLADANAVAARFRDSGKELEGTLSAIGTDLALGVGEANRLIAALGDVNRRLGATAPGTAQHASLLDQRDALGAELAGFVPIEMSPTARGFEIRMAGAAGPLLVGDGHVSALGIDISGEAPQLTIDAHSSPRPLSGLADGRLQGLIDAHRTASDALARLDRLADRFVAAMNAAHMAGTDFLGARGEPLFSNRGVAVAAGPLNRGGASVAATIDVTATASGDYLLVHDAASGLWTLSRADGSGAVSGAGTLTLDGMTVSPGGAAETGDRFTLTPRRGAAVMAAIISDPNRVAAASPWQSAAAPGNTAGATLSVTVDASTAWPPSASYSLTWDTETSVTVRDAGGAVVATLPYAPGDTIEGAGFSLRPDRQPAAGDRFTIHAAGAGSADNGAMRNLAALQSSGGFEVEFAAQRSAIATATADARRNRDTADLAARETAAARDNASGVNLDEEAANILRFQQAFEAATRVIAVAREIFDSILEAS